MRSIRNRESGTAGASRCWLIFSGEVSIVKNGQWHGHPVIIQATGNQSYGRYSASRRQCYLRLAAVIGSESIRVAVTTQPELAG